jgi:hypothetical protein
MVTPVSRDAAVGTDLVVTWHHGLIARWWTNLNLDAPEIEFFRSSSRPIGLHSTLSRSESR